MDVTLEPLDSVLARMHRELREFNEKRPVPTNPETRNVVAVKAGDAVQFVEVGHE